jgi:hypothetical protein
VSLVVGAVELSGSIVDVWFDGLLHDVRVVELFLLCRIYGGICTSLSYLFVRCSILLVVLWMWMVSLPVY